MKFYRVKFPTDTIWIPENPIISKIAVQEALIAQVTQHIKDNLELVDVDPQTRAVVSQLVEETG